MLLSLNALPLSIDWVGWRDQCGFRWHCCDSGAV